jgi:glucose-6-phosphate dehydrogenase assembly protein OpcA
MAPAVSAMRVTGTPERADVSGVERELRRLWSSLDSAAASSAAASAGAQITRICTLTFLAVVRNGDRRQAAALAERLGERYPSRSIVVDLNPAEDARARQNGRLGVEIALYCHARGSTGRQAVCCEQIAVTASGRAIARVPALITPLLVPDLPVYVWCPDDPPAGGPAIAGDTVRSRGGSGGGATLGPAPDPAAELLRRLAEAADALIVDSAVMHRPVAGLAAAAAFARPLPGGLRDLTWGRLTPWRDVIVQCFDPAPMRQALDRLERVRVRTEGKSSDRSGTAGSPSNDEPIAGLLLGAWLAGRLGWEPAGPARRDGGRLGVAFRRDGAQLELEIEGGAGPVASFECSARGSDPFALSITRRAGGAAAVDIETSPERGRSRTTAAGLAALDETALVGAELELTGPDVVLREALEIVFRMMHGVRS